MIKCILIYLWIYMGIYYVIEAADADEHVHIKLHMPRGQRKHAQHHQTHHKKRQLPLHYNSAPPLSPREPPQLYHETPHNYLTTTAQQQQYHLHQHTKKLPSTPHLYETIGQLLEADDVYSSAGNDDATEEAQHMTYLAENFALFPQPSTSTTYETEFIPQNSQGFHHVYETPEETDEDEDNEISGPGGNGSNDSELIMLEEEPKTTYHQRFSQPMKNEQQLLQQIYQEQQEQQQQQQHNQFEQADFTTKRAKHKGNNFKKAEKQYHSEDDMTESQMYSSSSLPHSTTTFTKGNNDKLGQGGNSGFKSLTVDDIWSQLQRQYLSKYVPQAQSLTTIGDDHEEEDDGGGAIDEASLKATTKRKRTTIRQNYIKPTALSSSFPSSSSRQPTTSFWPAKTLNYDNNHQQQQQQQQQLYSFSTSPTRTTTELFDDTKATFRRPYNKFNAAPHHADSGVDDNNDDYDDVRIQFNNDHRGDAVVVYDDNNSSNRDASFEENVYQRGKKYVGNTGHIAYGNNNVQKNPFHDFYDASYSTPITAATVATKIHASTYHPKLKKKTSSFASSSSSPSFIGDDTVSPTLSHESTSYQWQTQQLNPESYQNYHSHHQQQEPTQHQQHQQFLPHQHRFRQLHQPQSSALRSPQATITQMPSTASTVISSTFASSLAPTIVSNDFSSSSATKSTIQHDHTRYKKRKNRIKIKKNRIVVV